MDKYTNLSYKNNPTKPISLRLSKTTNFSNSLQSKLSKSKQPKKKSLSMKNSPKRKPPASSKEKNKSYELKEVSVIPKKGLESIRASIQQMKSIVISSDNINLNEIQGDKKQVKNFSQPEKYINLVKLPKEIDTSTFNDKEKETLESLFKKENADLSRTIQSLIQDNTRLRNLRDIENKNLSARKDYLDSLYGRNSDLNRELILLQEETTRLKPRIKAGVTTVGGRADIVKATGEIYKLLVID